MVFLWSGSFLPRSPGGWLRDPAGPYRSADLRSSPSCRRASSSIRYGYIVFAY